MHSRVVSVDSNQVHTITPKKLNKHDTYLEELSQRVAPDYDQILKGVRLYSKRRRLIGEIDLLAKKGDFYDVYEVKCSPRIAKAKGQLKKIRKILYDKNIRKTFLFCGSADLIIAL